MEYKFIFKVSKNRNLGDGIVYYGLIEKLCETNNIDYIDLRTNCEKKNYILIGSALRNCDKNTIVCGSGFICKNADLGCLDWSFKNKVYSIPEKILFVRGKKTREKLINMGVDCPEKYGDMGVILPLVYKNNIVKKTIKVGILPHYVDKNKIDDLKNYLDENNITFKVLNIMSAHNAKELIDDVCSCEYLITSTLHGIILGISYNIKSIWLKFSNNVTGSNFKYYDFFSSLNIDYDSVKIDKNILNNYIKVDNKDLYNLGYDILSLIPFFSNEETREKKINEWKLITSSYNTK